MSSNKLNIRQLIGLLVVAAIVVAIAMRISRPDNKKDRSLKIDDTGLVVTEIKKISKLVTACWYEDVVMSDTKPSRYFGSDDLCIIVKGNVRTGYDFSRFNAGQLKISGDTVSIALPEPEILEVIVNPSGTEVYDESGSWSHEEIRALTNKARARLINDARASGILDKARGSAEAQLDDLFRSMGFVDVKFENQD